MKKRQADPASSSRCGRRRGSFKRADDMQCERCQQLLIEIERYGDHLIGCVECNCWQSNKSAFIMDLAVGDIQALRDGRQTPHLRRRDVAGDARSRKRH